MALSACILIKTVPLQTEPVLEKTRSLKGVKKAFIVYGRYDMVAFVEASGYPEIRKLDERDKLGAGRPEHRDARAGLSRLRVSPRVSSSGPG